MKTTMTTRQLTKFLQLLEQKGMTPDWFQTLLGTGVFADIFDSDAMFTDRDQWRKALGISDTKISVDYSRSHDQQIAVGNYGYVDRNIITKERFPITGEGVEEYEFRYFLSPFEYKAASERIISLIEDDDRDNPWHPAEFVHLLAYGEKFPERQRRFPIVALGSVGKINTDYCVTCLTMDGSRRALEIAWVSHGFGKVCRFLAVRRIIKTLAS